VNSNASDPAPRRIWQEVIRDFQSAHPGITVVLNTYDHESYKKALPGWLTGTAPDVVFWNAGQRMRQFVEPGLLRDVSAIFTPPIRALLNEGAIDLVTVGGHQFGVPFALYPISLYLRRDLLEKAGVKLPIKSWNDLLSACVALRHAGVTPVAIGTRDLWPAAAWFDQIDLRLNGPDFHADLMAGRVPYNDQRVRAVFGKWKELIDAGCFLNSHASLSWQEAQLVMNQGRAAMMLMGNFIVPNFPPELLDRIELAPFPLIDRDVIPAEEAPVNSLHIPSAAKNPEEAEIFLAYVLQQQVQERLARGLAMIPVNRDAGISDDRLLKAGIEQIAGVTRLSQYYDRDSEPALALVGMKAFQEFMMHPERLDTLLDRIEKSRQTVVR
jgi:multiple sugar transport system substrate-binding protein